MLGYLLTSHSLCLCVCLCSRAPVGQPITGQILPATGPPSAAAQSTLHLLRSPRCPLCTVALLHDQRLPARYTGLPDTAKRQGSSWIKERKQKWWRGMSAGSHSRTRGVHFNSQICPQMCICFLYKSKNTLYIATPYAKS